MALSVLISSLDQYRWRSIGIVIGIYILQALLFALGKSTAATKFLLFFTFISAYQPDWMVQAVSSLGISATSLWSKSGHWPGFQFGPAGYSLFLIGMGLIAYAVALRCFARRDLPAPL
jgi:ABC-2 type transport system permease protein